MKPGLVAQIGGDSGETAGKTRGEKKPGLDRDVAQVEQLAPARSARRLAEQHGVGREERGKHHHVAEDEDPEAVAGDDALGRGTGMRYAGRFHATQMMRVAVRICDRRVGHHALPGWLASARRSAMLARSIRATSAAGMTYSSWSRQANTTNVANAPTKPNATIHQMCQIKAKPITVAKNAQTNPVGELRGISMSS